MAITTTDIVTEWGSYYLNSGQNMSNIRRKLTQGLETPKHATSIKTDDTIYRIAKATLQSLVQPFQTTFTKKGGVEFAPKEIRLFKMKMDDEFDPDELEATWLGFLTDNNVSRKDWPLVKWLMEEYYIPQINQDMELNEYFKGKYSAPSEGVAGANGTSMDGLKKLLTDGIDDGTINNLFSDIGMLEAATIHDQIEDAMDLVGEVYQGIPMKVFVSQKMYRAYMRDKRGQGFYQKTSDNEINNNIDFTPQSVQPLPCIVDFPYFFATPKANFLHITKKSANKNKFKVEEAKRSVAVMADWFEGLGFGMNEIVWTNYNGSGSASA